MNKRIILVGPSAAGKNFIREKFVEKGFKADCSYTSRESRPGEIDGVDYKFIGTPRFMEMIAGNKFYEWVEYNGNFYGTGLDEWNNCDIFIMESDGIGHLKPEDRKCSVVIYINTPFDTRLKRMRQRGWSNDKITERSQVDIDKFRTFTNFDLEISSETQIFM